MLVGPDQHKGRLIELAQRPIRLADDGERHAELPRLDAGAVRHRSVGFVEAEERGIRAE
nr:hypothetical protein [Chelatococcus sambhunathii]